MPHEAVGQGSGRYLAQRASLCKTIERLHQAGLIAVRQTQRDQRFPERTVYELLVVLGGGGGSYRVTKSDASECLRSMMRGAVVLRNVSRTSTLTGAAGVPVDSCSMSIAQAI